MSINLEEFVEQFAAALDAADARRPVQGKFDPGIGPHHEDRAVDLIVTELRQTRPAWHIKLQQRYPASRQTCDLLLGQPPEWAIEVKMARPNHSVGTPDPAAVKDILSPFAADRSALSDCRKMAESDIAPRKAILIYGFDDADRPLTEMIAAFETLARTRVTLGPRSRALIGPLVHPIHRMGAVFGWEVKRRA